MTSPSNEKKYAKRSLLSSFLGISILTATISFYIGFNSYKLFHKDDNIRTKLESSEFENSKFYRRVVLNSERNEDANRLPKISCGLSGGVFNSSNCDKSYFINPSERSCCNYVNSLITLEDFLKSKKEVSSSYQIQSLKYNPIRILE